MISIRVFAFPRTYGGCNESWSLKSYKGYADPEAIEVKDIQLE